MCRFVLRGYNYYSSEPKCPQNADSSTEGNLTTLAQEHLMADRVEKFIQIINYLTWF